MIQLKQKSIWFGKLNEMKEVFLQVFNIRWWVNQNFPPCNSDRHYGQTFFDFTYKQTFRLVHVDNRGPECTNRFRFEVRLFTAWRRPVDRRKWAGNVDNVVRGVRDVRDTGSGFLKLDVFAVFAFAGCWNKLKWSAFTPTQFIMLFVSLSQKEITISIKITRKKTN